MKSKLRKLLKENKFVFTAETSPPDPGNKNAIIDEVDSVLIDDARTPLIISGPTPTGDKHEFNELKHKIEKLVSTQKK